MNDKELRDEIVSNVQTFMKTPQTQIGGENYFSEKDVKHLISELLKTVNKDELLNALKLSLRMGGIIIIEEEISCNKIKRSDIKLEDIIRKVIVEYKDYIRQRNINKLKSVEHIHPEKPCIQYEDSERSMGEYLKALTFILSNQLILIDDPKVSEGLENAKNKVIGCDNKS